MNKNKLFKTIEQLKNNILKDIDNHEQSKLYIRTWVIGALDMLTYKAQGKKCMVYPYNATYKELLNDFFNHFICLHISEEIKQDTYNYLNSVDNIILVEQLFNIIK